MFCNRCGENNPEISSFCSRCGQPLNSTAATAPPPLSPAGAPTEAYSGVPVTDGKAIAALVLGLLTFVVWIFAAIPAIILGHLSRSDIKKSGGRLKGDGMALTGLVIGYLSIAAVPLILIIAAIAIPNFMRARTAANEASAVGEVRRINRLAAEYHSTHGQSYPENFRSFDSTSPRDSDDGYRGYSFNYAGFDADGDGKWENYLLIATPITQGQTGRRTYCSDSTAVIRYSVDGSCDMESPAIPG